MLPISIIMPVYNSEIYVTDTIKSILSQTFVDFELLILNDGSTDNSLNEVKKITDPRVNIFDLEHNYIDTLNYGLKIAKGKYIVRFDSDDIILSNSLDVLYKFMENNPDIACCSGRAKCVGSRQDIIGYNLSHNDISLTLLYNTALIHGCSIYRNEVIKSKNISYNHDFVYAEDYKLWTDFVMNGYKLATLTDVLIQYNCHTTQTVQTQTDLMWRNAAKTKLVYTEYVLNLLIDNDLCSYDTLQELHDIAKASHLSICSHPFVDVISLLYRKYLEMLNTRVI